MAMPRVERIRVPEAQVPEIAVRILSDAIATAVAERGEASLCLAGGNTPRATYEALAKAADIAWPRVSIYFGDERAVPPEHPDSNYRLARAALLDHVPIAQASLHRMRAEDPDRHAAANAYSEELPDAFDALILGVGEDGHTASLFPGSPALHETERLVVPVTGPKPPFDRMTLTPPALARGRMILVLVAGASKADAVSRALEGPLDVDACPVQLVRDAIWILDHAAAAKLTGTWP